MQESRPNPKPTIHDENIGFVRQMHQITRNDVDSRLAEHWDPTIPKAERRFDPTDFEDVRVTMAGLHRVAAGYDQQNREHKKLDEISRDGVTESLVPQSFNTLMAGLEEDGIFEEIERSGWTVQVCLLDLDKLGQHNNLGGHTGGGDKALKVTNETLARLFRRNGGAEGKDLPSDARLPSILEHEEQIKVAIKKGKMHDVLVRFGGDEFLVVSFIPEDQNNRRTDGKDLHDEVERLEKAFSGVRVIYEPIQDAVSGDKINQDGIVINTTKLEDGSVSAEVTATFCLTRIDNANPETISEAIEELDKSIKAIKKMRKGLETKGAIHDDFLKRGPKLR